MIVQTFMLSLTARGFGSVPQLLLAMYPDVVREEFGVSDDYQLMVGVSFGKPDSQRQPMTFISPEPHKAKPCFSTIKSILLKRKNEQTNPIYKNRFA